MTKAVMKAASRLSPGVSSAFLRRVFDTYDDPEIRAHALIGLHRVDKEAYTPQIKSWLASTDLREKRAGIISAGGSGRKSYFPLKYEWQRSPDHRRSRIDSSDSSLPVCKAPV